MGDVDAAYNMKFSCYDGTFGKDKKEAKDKWIRLRSLGLSSVGNRSSLASCDFLESGD